jgi:hypothetical protein
LALLPQDAVLANEHFTNARGFTDIVTRRWFRTAEAVVTVVGESTCEAHLSPPA